MENPFRCVLNQWLGCKPAVLCCKQFQRLSHGAVNRLIGLGSGAWFDPFPRLLLWLLQKLKASAQRCDRGFFCAAQSHGGEEI